MPRSAQIIQLVDDAVADRRPDSLALRRAAPRLEADAARVLDARAAGKTVGENLVKDGVFDPIGRLDIHSESFSKGIPKIAQMAQIILLYFMRSRYAKHWPGSVFLWQCTVP